MGLYKLTGWTIYYDNMDVMTFRHRCGWEVTASLDIEDGTNELLKMIRDHIC